MQAQEALALAAEEDAAAYEAAGGEAAGQMAAGAAITRVGACWGAGGLAHDAVAGLLMDGSSD